uniref:Uncharacterized protein n=1 Tax=Arabidopsis thaliana TaxID=3702 RepID=Q0TV73_ARATH|nr:hypothetical protein [Arabidopsis thaliana]
MRLSLCQWNLIIPEVYICCEASLVLEGRIGAVIVSGD